MKFNNILLLILICLISYKQFFKIEKVSFSKENNAIVIKPKATKSIIPEVLNKNSIKHSTTLDSYVDTDGRNTLGVRHTVRIGKEYYISGGITSRESSYDNREVAGRMSITKYW